MTEKFAPELLSHEFQQWIMMGSPCYWFQGQSKVPSEKTKKNCRHEHFNQYKKIGNQNQSIDRDNTWVDRLCNRDSEEQTNKNIESLSSVHTCELSTPQWPSTQSTWFLQTRQSAVHRTARGCDDTSWPGASQFMGNKHLFWWECCNHKCAPKKKEMLAPMRY